MEALSPWRRYFFKAGIGVLVCDALIQLVAFLRYLYLHRFIGVIEGTTWLNYITSAWLIGFFLVFFGKGKPRLAALAIGIALAMPFTLINW